MRGRWTLTRCSPKNIATKQVAAKYVGMPILTWNSHSKPCLVTDSDKARSPLKQRAHKKQKLNSSKVCRHANCPPGCCSDRAGARSDPWEQNRSTDA